MIDRTSNRDVDHETDPLRGFVSFLTGRVLPFGRFLGLFWTLTDSVHTLHMHKPVITFVFTGLRSGLLRYIVYTGIERVS